jgi:methionine synthase II (cobalamin-independent)
MEVFQNPSIELFRVYLPDIAAFTEVEHNPEESIVCTGKIKHTGKTDNLHQYEYVKSLLPKERWGEIKLTLPAPEWYHMRYKEGRAYDKNVYSNDDEYFDDLAVAYQEELEILYKAGLRNVQLDDPNMACSLTWGSFSMCTC